MWKYWGKNFPQLLAIKVIFLNIAFFWLLRMTAFMKAKFNKSKWTISICILLMIIIDKYDQYAQNNIYFFPNSRFNLPIKGLLLNI